MSAGGDHSCGLRSDGAILCWGRNTQFPPHNVAPTGTFSSVDAGNTAGTTWSCAVEADADLNCWGYNAYGRTSFPPGSFVAVGTGGTHACGLTDAYGIVCWGGRTANGAPMETPPAGIFTALKSGYDHTCALRIDQTIACLGDNSVGQATAPAGTFTALSTGDFHGCAVRTNGAVYCWGSNASGQLSVPDSLTQPAGQASPSVLQFAPRPEGTVSAPQKVTVTNTGAVDLLILGESFGGGLPGDYFVGASTCRGPVPGGKTCSIWVHFAPQGPGDRPALLVLDTNISKPKTLEVALFGTVPDRVKPNLTLAGAAKQRLVATKSVVFTASSDDACLLTVTAKLGARTLGAITPRAIPADVAKRYTIRLDGADLAALRAALARSGTDYVTVAASCVDATGNRGAATKRIQVMR